MPEILTESFCERCGTRYTFESSASRAKPLRGLKTIGKGLRNFVLSDDSSMDEAMAAARSEAERDVTSRQLDAFHSTFNFCMSCRQYTCANCWNEAEGQCLSCSPLLAREAIPAPFPTADMAAQALDVPVNGTHEAPDYEAPTAWPALALEADESSNDGFDEIDLGARLAALDIATDGPAEDEVPAAEPEPIAAEAQPEPVTLEPEPLALEPEPLALEPEPEPEPVAVAEPEPEPVAAAQPPLDVVQQPVWLSVAPDPDATPAESPAQAPANGGLPAAASGAMVVHGVGPAVGETQAVEEILGAGALLAADYPADVVIPDRTVTLYPMRHTTGLAPHPDRNETAVTIENEAGTRLVLADFDGANQRELFAVPKRTVPTSL